MRFIKLLRHDLCEGIFKKYKNYIIFSALTVVAFFECLIRSRSGEVTFSFGEYLIYIFGGNKKYDILSQTPFNLPYLWLLIHLLILWFTLNYSPSDLSGYGQQTIYRSHSRLSWWLSKCCWQAAAVAGYYLASWLIIMVLTALSGGEISTLVDTHVFRIIQPGNDVIMRDGTNMLAELTVLPLLFTASLGLLQLTLCLFVKPVTAYIISALLCLSSTYMQSPLVFGNYAMAVRSEKVILNGMNAGFGIASMTALSVICIIAGAVKFRKYDILNKGD